MLESYEAAAADTPVAEVATVRGTWPAVAPLVETADVVVAANVVYNVPDIVPFVLAAHDRARHRVVVELPWLTRRSRSARCGSTSTARSARTARGSPTSSMVLAEIGIQPVIWRWDRPPYRPDDDPAAYAAWVRRRLCLPYEREPEVAALLAEQPRGPIPVATVWWDTGAVTARRPRSATSTRADSRRSGAGAGRPGARPPPRQGCRGRRTRRRSRDSWAASSARSAGERRTPSRIVVITASSPASSISWRTASSVADAWSGRLGDPDVPRLAGRAVGPLGAPARARSLRLGGQELLLDQRADVEQHGPRVAPEPRREFLVRERLVEAQAQDPQSQRVRRAPSSPPTSPGGARRRSSRERTNRVTVAAVTDGLNSSSGLTLQQCCHGARRSALVDRSRSSRLSSTGCGGGDGRSGRAGPVGDVDDSVEPADPHHRDAIASAGDLRRGAAGRSSTRSPRTTRLPRSAERVVQPATEVVRRGTGDRLRLREPRRRRGVRLAGRAAGRGARPVRRAGLRPRQRDRPRRPARRGGRDGPRRSRLAGDRRAVRPAERARRGATSRATRSPSSSGT